MKEPMLLVAVKDEGPAVMQLNDVIPRGEGALNEKLLLQELDGAMIPPGIQELDQNSLLIYRKIVQDTFAALDLYEHENVSREDFIVAMNLNYLELIGERSAQAAEERLSKNTVKKDSKVVEPSWSEDDSSESLELEIPIEHNILDTSGEVHVNEPTVDLGEKLENFELELELYALKPKDPASESDLISAASDYVENTNDREMALVRVLSKIRDVVSDQEYNQFSAKLSEIIYVKGDAEKVGVQPSNQAKPMVYAAFQKPISLVSIWKAADRYFSNPKGFESKGTKAVSAFSKSIGEALDMRYSEREGELNTIKEKLKSDFQRDKVQARADLITQAILYVAMVPAENRNAQDSEKKLLQIENVLQSVLKEKMPSEEFNLETTMDKLYTVDISEEPAKFKSLCFRLMENIVHAEKESLVPILMETVRSELPQLKSQSPASDEDAKEATTNFQKK